MHILIGQFVLQFFVRIGEFISVVFLLGHSAYADSGGDDYIVYLKTPQNRIRAAQSETNKNYITASADELQKLLKDGNVTFYEPNCEVKLFEDFSGDQATVMLLSVIPIKIMCK